MILAPGKLLFTENWALMAWPSPALSTCLAGLQSQTWCMPSRYRSRQPSRAGSTHLTCSRSRCVKGPASFPSQPNPQLRGDLLAREGSRAVRIMKGHPRPHTHPVSFHGRQHAPGSQAWTTRPAVAANWGRSVHRRPKGHLKGLAVLGKPATSEQELSPQQEPPQSLTRVPPASH